MKKIHVADECNDTYGRIRMYQALKLKHEQDSNYHLPSERTVYRVIFDCYDLAVIGVAMDTNMKAPLCTKTLTNAIKSYPILRGAIIHSDRGSQYTSSEYRSYIKKYNLRQSMNSNGGRCHDNARCESMWARMKTELLYDRYNTEKMSVEDVRTIIWRYFMSYWNNRRICSANDGLSPMVKRQRYYEAMARVA